MPENVDYDAYRCLIGRFGVRTTATRHLTNYWLTDEIITEYGRLLHNLASALNPSGSRRSHFLNPQFYHWLTQTNRGYDYEGVSTWHGRFPSTDIFNDLKNMIIPICVNNTHWSCILIDFQLKRIQYVDSLGVSGEYHLRMIKRYLSDYAAQHQLTFDVTRWTTVDSLRRAPQQENSYDCGVCVLVNAFLTVMGFPLEYTQAGLDACESRKIIALSLLHGKALPPITISRAFRRNLNVIEHDFESRPKRDDEDESDSDSSSDGSTYSKDKVLKRVRKVLFKKTDDEDTFDPDWVRCHGWLQTLYGKDNIPTFTPGLDVLTQRAMAEEYKLTNTPGVNASKIIRKKRASTFVDWRNITLDVAKQNHMTDNLKVNTNGLSKTKGKKQIRLL